MSPRTHWLHYAAEHYALPAVCAFGMGVLITLHATDAEIELHATAHRSALEQVEAARIACGAQPDPAAIATTFFAQPHEARK